ncbi:MAG: hypothetical protein IKO90_03430 [Bacteroidales bacterium]|nr:hypothetical protein [Bacteroidales bacterium]MBQ4216209.1 hypothetical protein [Bacteroidales bacterium]MBR4689498.1 hypothetical protein [Bacteroidales bacterium]
MPYRRLPNTDAARVRALQAAIDKGSSVSMNECAISPALLLRAKFFLPSLRSGILQCRSSYSQSVEKGANFSMMQKRAKMYISHFIQVLNMAILRGEMKPNSRDFYGLKGKKLPSLETTEEILEWGKRLIDGEAKRSAAGGTYMTNPRISMVKIEYEKFAAAARSNEFRQTYDQRTSDFINDLRERGDAIIQEIWNEVEAHFQNLPPDQRREACAQYGISYVWRKSELTENVQNTEEIKSE